VRLNTRYAVAGAGLVLVVAAVAVILWILDAGSLETRVIEFCQAHTLSQGGPVAGVRFEELGDLDAFSQDDERCYYTVRVHATTLLGAVSVVTRFWVEVEGDQLEIAQTENLRMETDGSWVSKTAEGLRKTHLSFHESASKWRKMKADFDRLGRPEKAAECAKEVEECEEAAARIALQLRDWPPIQQP